MTSPTGSPARWEPDPSCSLTARRDEALIRFDRQVRDGQPAWVVSDNGDGFDMAHARHLFTPFQRVHKADEFEGSGIGLSIVHRIIRKHGGTVGFEAAPGQGAAFWFTLGQEAADKVQPPDGC